ncbi:unnamed protein product, partial [Candidula unifasciata]
MASKCTKFLPNIFNKSKCQHCFAAKEAHTAEALENNKASRKVSKCGYLFISPGYDFSNPVDRTRRWQRRFFRLYDDGELSYSVDENPDTVPQGVVDMNKCTDVQDAEAVTSHQFSLSVTTPEITLYVKGNSKEEIQWWQDILGEFPKALKAIRPRRKQPFLILSSKENQLTLDMLDAKQAKFDSRSRIDAPAFATFRGVRSLKHKYDSHYQDGLRKSSSLHDLSTEEKVTVGLESSRFLSRSGDRLDSFTRSNTMSLSEISPDNLLSGIPANSPFSIPHSTWTRTGQPIPQAFLSPKKRLSSLPSAFTASLATSGSPSRSSDNPSSRELSSSLKDFSTTFSLPSENDGENMNQPGLNAEETEGNETDELKMARNSELTTSRVFSHSSTSAAANLQPVSSKRQASIADLVYMKKGWLIKQAANEKESRKHWFVLAGNSLRYYKDAKAEESNILDGRIDLSSCYEVSELPTHRNYGFKIKTGNGEYTLAAMTLGIRDNWMKAIRLCMELHSTVPKWKLASSPAGTAHSTKSPPRASLDDLEFKLGVAESSTTAVTGAGGETAFQLVGHKDPYRRESQKPIRRHHSDVSPGNVSKMLSVKEFTAGLEPAGSAAVSPASPSTSSSLTSSRAQNVSADVTSRVSKKPKQHSPTGEYLVRPSRNNPAENMRDGTPKMKRFVEGSDNMPIVSSGAAAQGPEQAKSIPKRSVTSESTKEEVKREMMRRAKSPSARVKEKSRAAKSPRMNSADESFSYHSGSATASESDTIDGSSYRDLPMSEDEFTVPEDTDLDEVGSATASDIVGSDGALVEILETEVESLKDRLEHTQTELDKMHKDNMDLKSRLHKETSQSLDSGYSTTGRWGVQNPSQNDAASGGPWNQGSAQTETLKRQLKEARDTVQKQKLDIENLKSKLDMSISKLTGTEKALSEALRDYKLEKDKFLKLSSEWNRRIRSMEGQSKDSIHKLEMSRETLQLKERECRRLEAEMKNNQQRLRDQEREILKLKAVEHEYNQLKEKLDDREHELSSLKSEMKEKDHLIKKLKEDYERQLEDLDREYTQERDDFENHVEQLKSQLFSAHDRQVSLTDNMTSDLATMLKEKDDIIAQLEEKVIEADKKLVELSNELHLEMGENADLAHTIEMLQNEKLQLIATAEEFENQLMSLKTTVSGLESDNFALRKQMEELRKSNKLLSDSLNAVKIGKDVGAAPVARSDDDRERLNKTILELNKQIKDLQVQLDKAEGGVHKKSTVGNGEFQQDLLHTILMVDSDLKEVNIMLQQLRHNFDNYIGSLDEENQDMAIKLADLVEDIGQRCHAIQDKLHEAPEVSMSPSESEFRHEITVSADSNSNTVMEEYKSLKVKFDRAVAELKQAKKALKDMNSVEDSVRIENLKLKDKLTTLEGSCKQQIIELVARVDELSAKLSGSQPGYIQERLLSSLSDSLLDTVKETEKQLIELGKKISLLEQQATNQQPSNIVSSSRAATDPGSTLVKLQDIKNQLEDTSLKITNLLHSLPQSPGLITSSALQAKVKSYKNKVESLITKTQLSDSHPYTAHENTSQISVDAAAAGFSDYLQEIRRRVLEIGEQLDSLDEDDEDSDDEDEGEQTTVEEIRGKLAELTESIEQHSSLTTSDWALLRLMSLQKASVKAAHECVESVQEDSVTDEDKLKLYADKLSLEAVILSEMASILQTRNFLLPEDILSREIDSLNSKILRLHQCLDSEIKTMHFDDPQADLLSSYVELMAEKLLVNGHLCSATSEKTHIVIDSSSSLQPVLLATETLVRSQIDSFISNNMDRTANEILTLPTHLTARTIVQGELTYCLNQLKSKLELNPEVLTPGPANYQFMFDRLTHRQRTVLDTLECYCSQIIHSLAVIIFKESEEMTIVEGPESVLEAMCSEISTVIEKHIQNYKEKYRTAMDTHSARKYDIIVDELRSSREAVLSQIKAQHETYAKDPASARDSSLDIPVQSLDSTINNFGEIIALKSVVVATTNFLAELLKMGSAVLTDLTLDQDMSSEDGSGLEKGVSNFVSALSNALHSEAVSKERLARKMSADHCGNEDSQQLSDSIESIVLHVPNLSHHTSHLPGRMEVIIREAVLNAQLTFSLFKQKLLHDHEVSHLKARRPVRTRPELSAEESRDSDDTLDLQTDFQVLLVPMEEVLESKHDDEVEVLQVILGLISQMKATLEAKGKDQSLLDDQLRQLEQKLQHEVELAQQRHETQLEVFKQESGKLVKILEEQQQDRDHYEDRCAQLEDELTTLQLQHEEEKDRVKQDILTAVHAIRSNDEKSEMHLIEKATKLSKELVMQKLNWKKTLGMIKKEVSSKDKSSLVQLLEDHISAISLSADDETDDYHPPLPVQPPPDLPDGKESAVVLHSADIKQPAKTHMDQVEQLRKEKEEALAEEMRNTKAALDAVRTAYEEELTKEKAKYKEALMTMYTEEYVNEIRLRNQEEEQRMTEELQKLNMHYTSKCEDYKLLEMKLQQIKQDYESHISQLSS